MSAADVSQPDVAGLTAYYAKKGAVPNALVYLENSMREQLCELLGVSQVSGGAEYFTGGSCIGGYDALQDYGNSMFSKAKEKLIRDIADDVFSALKSSGVKNARTAPIGDVVASLSKLLPPRAHSARKFGKDFNKSSESQRKVCHALANSLNRHYGGAIIDMSANESDMCNKVAEVMYSLFTGLHTEFMTVAGDVLRVMNNMQTVMNYVKAAYNKQKELVDSSSDASLREQSANTDSVYKQILAEYERQTAVLANLINVTVGPTGKSLISSLEDNRDFSGLVKDIKSQVGTAAFGDKLAYLLAGVSSVAHSAELIDKALKKIGMSAQEFKSAKNAGDLRMKVMNSMMKGHPSSKQLDDMMRAAQVIYNNNYDHDAISKALSGSKSGRGEGDEDSDVDGDAGGDAGGDAVLGGDDDDKELPAYWAKKSLSKKLDLKEKYRKMILNDFRKVLRGHFQGIMDSANNIAHHIGESIPLSDELDHFVRVFGDLKSLDEENLHLALSGYPKDSRSREKREKFFNDYEIVINTLDSLSKGPHGSDFKNLQNALRGMLKVIDDFSDKMVKALTEIHVDSPDEIASSLRKTSSLFYGSSESNSFGSGSWVAFDKIKMELKYFYSIANIKTNIARSADDLKSYSSDYEQILGEEAGWLINRIRAEFKALLEMPDPLVVDPIGGAAITYTEPPDLKELAGSDAINRAKVTWEALHAQHQAALATMGATKDAAIAAVATTFKNLKVLWDRQMNAKVNMVKVAQAVDLYLKSFTDGISRNPDSVKSVVMMLDQVEIVARWFNDKSGDNLASLFEVFPCGVDIGGGGGSTNLINTKDFLHDNPNAFVDTNGKIANVMESKHYYQVVEEIAHSGARLPGNPFLGRPLSGDITTEKQLGGILTLSERVVKSMRALENLLSVFSSVGSKFGDLDPAAHTFMNPGQIFKAMCDYLTASAFATQFDPTDPERVAAVYRGKVIEEKTSNAGGGTSVNIPEAHAQIHTRPEINVGTLDAANDVVLAQNNALNGGTIASPAVLFKNERGILVGVSDKGKALVGGGGGANAVIRNRKVTSLAMAAIPADTKDVLLAGDYWNYHSMAKREIRLDAACWRDECYDTDFLLLMTVKSIVAKVFTVVDAYRLFHRPTTGFGSHYSLNPLRTILGGADSANGGVDGGVDGGAPNKVPVVREAIELYLRLPLLAEWYRENYGFNKIGLDVVGKPNEWKLSLVPNIDGVWSGFVNIMFDKADFVTEGNYTETQVQALIGEMNQIWKLYKSKYPKATVRQIINAFVIEMNRIFGFVKAKEINRYLEQRRDYLKEDTNEARENFFDYDILNANDQFGSRPAPSDKFVSVGLKPVTRKEREYVHLMKAINDLRRKIDSDFISATSSDGNATFTFIDTLRNYKNEMANAKNDEEEYKIVLRMIQGASKQISLGTEKLIMIHETIAAPLAALYATYKVMARYNALLHGCSLVNITGWSKTRTTSAEADLNKQLVNNTDALTSYKKYLNSVAYKDRAVQAGTSGRDTVHLALFGRMLTGNAPEAALNDNCGYLVVGGGLPNTNVALNKDNLDATTLCRDLLAAVLDLCANPNKLVTCAVGASGHINVDVGALEDLCKSTLAQIKENAKKLRQMFPPSHTGFVDKYENRETVGSTRWLEENLIQVLFEDRDKCGLPRAHADHLNSTLKRLFAPGAASAANAPLANDTRFGSMDLALQGLVYYTQVATVNSLPRTGARCDFNMFPFNVMPMRKQVETPEEKKVVSALTARDANGQPNNLAAAADFGYLNVLSYAPYLHFEDEDYSTLNKWHLAGTSGVIGNPAYKSLLLAFNNILHMYLYTNLEDGTNKFYAPLVESFAYGAASLEVVQGKAFPNVGQAGDEHIHDDNNRPLAGDGPLGAPADETIVFASNALVIRGLLTTVMSIGSSQKKKFIFENFAEIPEPLKDRMKVNLPFFSKMLQHLADRAALLRNIINNTELSKNLEHTAVGGAIQNPVLEVSSALSIGKKDTVQSATYYNGLLTKLSNLALDLKKCADGVYKELQDKVPYFLETSKDFLLDYRQRVSEMPVMPASSILAPLRCLERRFAAPEGPRPIDYTWTSSDESHAMLPVRENGSAAYRFNSATRLLLARNDIDVQIEHMPGAKELYNSYVTATSKGATLSPQEYANTIKNMVKLTKFLADGVVYGRLYDRPANSLNAPLNNKVTYYSSRNVFNAVGWRQENGSLQTALDANSIVSTIADAAVAGGRTGAGAALVALANAPDVNDEVTDAKHKIAVNAAAAGGAGAGIAAAGGVDAFNTYVLIAVGAIVAGGIAPTGAGVASPGLTSAYNLSLTAVNAAMDDEMFTATDTMRANRNHTTHVSKFTEILTKRRTTMNAYTNNAANIAREHAAATAGADKDTLAKQLANNLSCLALQGTAAQPSLSGLLELTENANVRANKERLSQAIGAEVSNMGQSDRGKLAVQNILEYNIVPINVHAFMREVPFVNLLNYSYTFDRMVHDFVLPSYVSRKRNGTGAITADDLMIGAGDAVASTRELMVKLLVHPYANLGNDGLQYFALAASLFNGNDDLKLGRPRYLSDQLWHKVLLTSSAQLVAGQDMFNNTGTPYNVDLKSLEAGPAAYEAVRAVVRYGAPKIDQVSTHHNMNPDAGNKILTALVRGIRNAASPAVEEYLYRASGAAVPAATTAAYNEFDNAAINIALDIDGAAGMQLVAVAALANTPEAKVVYDDLKTQTVIYHTGNAAIAENYEAQDPMTRALGVANGSTKMWQAALAEIARNAVTVAGNLVGGDAMIDASALGGASPLALNYDNVFQRMFADGAGSIANPQARYTAAVMAMRNPAVAFIDSNANAAFAIGQLNYLYRAMEANTATKGATAWARLPAPFNVPPAAAGAAALVVYNPLAFFVDAFPNHTDNTRRAVKMVLGLALQGDTNAQVLAALNSVTASNQYRNMNFFEQAFIQILHSVVNTRAAAGGTAASAAGEAAELVLIAFCQHAASGLRQLASLIDRVKSSQGFGSSQKRLAASTFFMLPSNPVASTGLKVLRPGPNGQWQQASMTNGTAVLAASQMKPANVLYCAELGKMRFDTKLVRNLTWLVQLQRIMHVVLPNHLAWLNTPVVRGLKIADPKITEYNANDTFDERDFTGENYSTM